MTNPQTGVEEKPEIGKLIGGADYSAVSQARNRLRCMLEKDGQLKARFENIITDLEKM